MTIKERINEGDASRDGDLLDAKRMLMDTVLGAKCDSKRAHNQGRLGVRLVFSIN